MKEQALPIATPDTLRPDEVTYLAALLRARTGVAVGQEKAYLFQTRLSVLARTCGLRTVRDVMLRLTSKQDAAFADLVVDTLVTKETSFYRHPGSFDVLVRHVVPSVMALSRFSPPIRIWSAGCSTGQEPYSISMAMREAGLCQGDAELEILATDMSETAVGQARSGRYSQLEIGRGLPAAMLMKHFRQEGHAWVISDQIRKPVKYLVESLLADNPLPRKFDIVFCRNVSIYFGPEEKTRLFARLAASIAAGGYLLLGGSENLVHLNTVLAQELRDGVVLHRRKEAP